MTQLQLEDKSEKNILVFVYGTLRRGGTNPAESYEAEYLYDAQVPGYIYNMGWYPGFKFGADNCSVVKGEIYRVNYDNLLALDRYEGCPNLYTRRTTIAFLDNTEPPAEIPVFIYEINEDMDYRDHIESGDWLDYLNEKED